MLVETYAKLMVKGLTGFLRNHAETNEVENEEDLRLVIKIEKGQLGAFLYDGPKFNRKVSFPEIVKLFL